MRGSSRKLLCSVSALALVAMTTPHHALAQSVLPSGGAVVQGTASVRATSNSALTITQTSPRAVVNWNSFSIGGANSVTFQQPGAGSAILNRVTGDTTSSIAGRLTANGQVFLVNPNGIAVTSTGTVQVGGGFVASSLNIRDDDFMSGALNFNGRGGPVTNSGSISASSGAFVALLGGFVANTGTITVQTGRIGLGAGSRATLDLSGDGFLQVAMPASSRAAAECQNGVSHVFVDGAARIQDGIAERGEHPVHESDETLRITLEEPELDALAATAEFIWAAVCPVSPQVPPAVS